MRKDIATTYTLAIAVGRCAGNRSAREHKSKEWSEHDFEVSLEAFHRLFWTPHIPDKLHK